jgi:NAD+ diphosphatase
MYNFCSNCGTHVTNRAEEFTCKKCGKSFYTNSKPTSTVIPIFNNKEVLVGIRAHEPQKGKYDFLGGFLNKGEHPLDGAVREFKEETGVSIKKEDLEYLDIWMDEYEFQGSVSYTLNMIYLLPVSKKMVVKAADDVADFKWISLDEDVAMAFKSQEDIFKRIKSQYRKNNR